MKVQFLIVGQGLAGSLLAFELSRRGQTILIVDNQEKSAASRVAAGLMNPVTGQRLVKTCEVDQCLPVATAYYQQLAQTFGRTFYYPKPMLRLFRSRTEQERYKNRLRQTEYQAYLGNSFAAGQSGKGVNDSLGGFQQLQTGYVAIPALLNNLKDYLHTRAAYRVSHVDYQDFQFTTPYIRWHDVEAERVIFCEGPNAVNNPWFRWLPFQLCKGEILSINTKLELPVSMINDGHWLLPIDRHNARVGATYDWRWNTVEPTESAKQTLMTSFQRMTGIGNTCTVTEHLAGIRPATGDKQPFIGAHPTRPYLGIFNGFGSKGSLLVPYYCRRYADYLLDNRTLPQTVDIARFEIDMSMTTLAKRHVSEVVKPGDTVIDATVGNGYDTEFLARSVGNQGLVFGFDVQRAAIESTAERLRQNGVTNQVVLINTSHENMPDKVPVVHHGRVKAIVFNLGYLPGRGKEVVTREHSTRRALEDAIRLLQVNGILSIVIYPGHTEGAAELDSISNWVFSINPQQFSTQWYRQNKKTTSDSPVLLLIHKLA